MAPKHLKITEKSEKKDKYETLLPQIAALTDGEPDMIANMANVAAAIYATFNFLWVGFYRVEGDALVLGPFQGPLACTRIAYGKGVCGTAWQTAEAIVVDDVDTFPGHIACNAASRSEIVIPVFRHDKVIAILDIDSQYVAHFDNTDTYYLHRIAEML